MSKNLEQALKQVPRLLGFMNRIESDPYYGCFDKQYWHYRTSDFPNARKQEGALVLALLYSNQFSGNSFYGKKKVLKWAEAAMVYWAGIQNKDGSLNEWYPNEHSYCATAVSSYALSEAYLILRDKLDAKTKVNLEVAFQKAGNWLVNNLDTSAMNQVCAAATALYNIHLILGEARFKEAAEERIKKIKELQSKEGWLPEYGGADIGYSTMALTLLADYYSKEKSRRIRVMANHLIDFISYFVHPDGTIGGEYGSRNTEFFLPYGFKVFDSSLSRVIVKNVDMSSLERVDDYYLTQVLYDVLKAETVKIVPKKSRRMIPSDLKSFTEFFPEAGLYVVKFPKYYAILGASKGGVLKVFGMRKLLHSDCGYLGRKRNVMYSTQFLNTQYEIDKEGREVSVSGKFHRTKSLVLTPSSNMVLRGFLILVNRNARTGRVVKEFVRKRLIVTRKRAEITFTRKFKFEPNGIKVDDVISSRTKVDTLSRKDKFSVAQVPISRLFALGEIDTESGKELADELNQNGIIEHTQELKI